MTAASCVLKDIRADRMYTPADEDNIGIRRKCSYDKLLLVLLIFVLIFVLILILILIVLLIFILLVLLILILIILSFRH